MNYETEGFHIAKQQSWILVVNENKDTGLVIIKLSVLAWIYKENNRMLFTNANIYDIKL